MDLAEQVLMVCPDIPRADVEKDLALTTDVQETINRIFEGNFLVGAAPPRDLSPAVAHERVPTPTLSSQEDVSLHGSVLRSCSDERTDSDDASDGCELPDVSLQRRVKQQDFSWFDEEVHVGAWSPSPKSQSDDGPSICSSISNSDDCPTGVPTESRALSLDLISKRDLSRRGTSLQCDALEQNASAVRRCTGKQLDEIRVAETLERETRLETIGSSNRRSEKETMDANNGRCSPMSISSDEEEGITLSLLHRIRSKRTTTGDPRTGVGKDPSGRFQDEAKACSFTTANNIHQSCKAPRRNAVHLLWDGKESRSDCPKTGASDDEDGASSRTHSSSTCQSSLPEAGPFASRWKDTGHASRATHSNSNGTPSQASAYDAAPVRRKAKRSPKEVAVARQQALERRAQKSQEKQEKLQRKEQKEREAQVQRALREAHKADKPEECMKYITVVIDPALLEDSMGASLLARLQELRVKTAVESQPIARSITWRRQVMRHNLGDDLQLQTLQHEREECETLVQLPVASFVDLVHIFKQEQQGTFCTSQESLRTYARNTQQALKEKAVTFIIQGMEKYFRLQKSSRQRDFRSAVLGNEPMENAAKVRRKKRPIEDITTVVTRVDVEEALVDLQLHVGCNVRFVDTPAEVADLVAMCTKSVAETPFKRERDKATFSFHVDTEWAGGVRVKKDGQGLRRVWRQQLQQFRNVSPEVSNAVVAAYPSPRLLLQAYARCESVQEARKALQDIVIRRGEGVLATTRRVGPELSKRIHTLLTSRRPDLDL